MENWCKYLKILHIKFHDCFTNWCFIYLSLTQTKVNPTDFVTTVIMFCYVTAACSVIPFWNVCYIMFVSLKVHHQLKRFFLLPAIYLSWLFWCESLCFGEIGHRHDFSWYNGTRSYLGCGAPLKYIRKTFPRNHDLVTQDDPLSLLWAV